MDKNDFAIDPHQLEEEWLKQPMLYERACQAMEDAMMTRDECKTNLETMQSTIYKRVVDDPEEFGLKKATVDSIKAAVDTNDDVVKAKKLLNTMNHAFVKAQNDVKTVDMRKKTLENLVQLFIAQYFSVPNEGKQIEGGKRFGIEATKKVKEEIAEKHSEQTDKIKRRRLGKFSDPVTSKEERDSISDEEKLNRMSPKAREAVEEINGRKEAKEGRETPRRRRRRTSEE